MSESHDSMHDSMPSLRNDDGRLRAALDFAVTCHAGQFRKSGERAVGLPYVIHPMNVAHTIWRWGVADAEMIAAALLHDVTEDCGVTADTIEQRFGSDVARWVAELTFDADGPITKEVYLRGFAKASAEALLIKVADRVCNTLDSRADDVDQARSYFRKAGELLDAFFSRYDELVRRFGAETTQRATADIAQLTAWVEHG
jgi:(p)ppGpp synthase/HD superfamily hydrolase